MTIGYGAALFPQHQALLANSAISPAHAQARGYVSVDTKKLLENLGVTRAGRNLPGLLVPSLRSDGSTWGYQYRPDIPRLRNGKAVKYETPVGQRNGLDVPPGVGAKLGNPDVPLFVTEGVKKADSRAHAGLCIVALPGVWSWRGQNGKGGRTAIADWHDVPLDGRRVILAFDSDVSRKLSVRSALDQLAAYLDSKGARVAYLHLPDDDARAGLDDYLAAGHDVDDLWRLVRPEAPASVEHDPGPEPPAPAAKQDKVASAPITLDSARGVFRRWLGEDYDQDALDVVLATAAAERLDGDPLWLLLISGSGNAKTETVQALAGIGATITSTISSPGALLSATSAKERTSHSTGGLLRKLGDSGVLVIKDVTSVLSMGREMRGEVLAALREVYDGRWSRNVGTDGGKTLDWTGRLAVVGAVTTAWDRAHDVIASMGDRFVLVRMDSTIGRQSAGRRAIANTGSETQMRAELAAAVGGVLAQVDPGAAIDPTDDEIEHLLAAADLVTRARTGVECDYRGNVIDCHAPEMPTRFAKQLNQVVRGAVAIGVPRGDALRLAIRCARDSMPPMRLAILDDVTKHPGSATREVRKRLGKPRATVDRQLQALHMLGVLTGDEEESEHRGQAVTVWRYSVSGECDATSLDPDSVPDLLVHPPSPQESQGGSSRRASSRPPTDNSGTEPDPPRLKWDVPIDATDQRTASRDDLGTCERCLQPASLIVGTDNRGRRACRDCCEVKAS